MATLRHCGRSRMATVPLQCHRTKNRAAMKRIFFLLLAANSWLGCGLANAEVRPRYGGTLHVATAEVLASLDPADASLNEPGAENILPLVFDALVSLDAQGVAKPDLANSWESSSNRQR